MPLAQQHPTQIKIFNVHKKLICRTAIDHTPWHQDCMTEYIVQKNNVTEMSGVEREESQLFSPSVDTPNKKWPQVSYAMPNHTFSWISLCGSIARS